MTKPVAMPASTDLRRRMIEDMNVRGFCAKTQHDYLRIVSRFAVFLGRSPGTASAEDVRQFQVAQREAGMPAPAMNSHVAALRFFFTTTLDRPDLARRLVRVTYPRRLPLVLSPGRGGPAIGPPPPASNIARLCPWPMAPVCAWPRLPGSRSPISTASAC